MKNFYYKKIFAAVVILFTTCVPGFADDHKEVADWHRILV